MAQRFTFHQFGAKRYCRTDSRARPESQEHDSGEVWTHSKSDRSEAYEGKASRRRCLWCWLGYRHTEKAHATEQEGGKGKRRPKVRMIDPRRLDLGSWEPTAEGREE